MPGNRVAAFWISTAFSRHRPECDFASATSPFGQQGPQAPESRDKFVDAVMLNHCSRDAAVVAASLLRKAFHIKGNDDLRWVSLTYGLQVF
jgi:hypothetical protein